MNVIETAIPGVVIFEPQVFTDARGLFFEEWNAARYSLAGLPDRFVQDNVSLSHRGVLRGLHYQEPFAQGKLVSVLRGEVYDVAVDIRCGSPTFAHWVGVSLSEHNRRQLYIPPGFAHGFQVVSADALFHYKCTEYYHAQFERSLLWCDGGLGIDWPLLPPVISDKDARGLTLADLQSCSTLPAAG